MITDHSPVRHDVLVGDVVQPRHGVESRVVLAVVAQVRDALAVRHDRAVAAVDQHLWKQGSPMSS